MVFIPLPDLNHEFESDIKGAGWYFHCCKFSHSYILFQKADL